MHNFSCIQSSSNNSVLLSTAFFSGLKTSKSNFIQRNRTIDCEYQSCLIISKFAIELGLKKLERDQLL